MLKRMPQTGARSPYGKTLRGGKDADGRVEHVLSAFCVALEQSAGHVSSRGKGLENPDALRLLDTLDLTGKIVTGDANFCQKTIASKITEKGGDYVLLVKKTRKTCKRRSKRPSASRPFPPGV